MNSVLFFLHFVLAQSRHCKLSTDVIAMSLADVEMPSMWILLVISRCCKSHIITKACDFVCESVIKV